MCFCILMYWFVHRFAKTQIASLLIKAENSITKKHVQLSVFFYACFQVFVFNRQLLLDGIVIIFYGSKHINSYLFFTDCVSLSRFVFHGSQIFESSKYFFVKS